MSGADAAIETRAEDRYVSRPADYWYVAGIMGLMGAFLWAIRGTSGFGGWNGGLVAGLGWGVLWYSFSHIGGGAARRPLATPWMLAAITFGIAYGGMTGYGVYIAWIQGKFYLDYPEGARDIAPWTGYAMLFICGLHWGGVTGAFMAWCGPNAAIKWWMWVVRIAAGWLGSTAALWFVNAFPQLFLPFYEEGLYEVREYATCQRALGSIRNIAPHVGFYLGFLAFEAGRRDWKAVGMMLVMGLGFAIPFTVGGYWQTFHGSDLRLDWWKNWEMSIGLGGGLAIGLAFYLFNRPESGDAPGRYSTKSYVLGAGLPIWFAATISIRNAYRGFSSIHGFEDAAEPYRLWFTLLFLVPATIALALWIARMHDPDTWRPGMIVGALIVLTLVAVVFHRIPMFGLIPRAVYRYSLLYLLPSIFILGYVLYRRDRLLDQSPLPNWLLAAVVLFLVVIGYAVSIHVPMQLNNYVLVTLYTIYILGSLGLFIMLTKGKGGPAAE